MSTTLRDALKSLPGDLILSDGGTTYDVDNLLESLQEYPEAAAREVLVGETWDGRVTITTVKPDGYLESIPTYTQPMDPDA